MSVYAYTATRIDGTEQMLEEFRGRVLLIVNTASQCGFTPQYRGLQALYEQYHDSGFEILGFPCNQFGRQEPGSSEEIAAFCAHTYAVTFPMFAKIEVNGPHTHPLYQYLKRQQKGVMGSGAIKWNFTKFLVNRQGHVIQRFSPTVSPQRLEPFIVRELQ